MMNRSDPNATSQNILVLGAGELGLPVLRNLARKAKHVKGAKISVLLRASAVESDDPSKQRDIAEIRDLGIEIVVGDLVKSSVDELAAVFARYDTVIGCAGYAAGIDTPMKLSPEWASKKQSELVVNRQGRVDEITPTALLLACEEAGFYVGATFNPNGGDIMV